MSKSNDVNALGVLLFGLAAGYVAGVLTAPKSGKETREDIKKASKKFETDVEARLHDIKEDLGVVIEDASKRVRDLNDKSRKELEGLIVKGKAAQAKAKEILSAVRHGEAEDKDLEKALEEVKSAKRYLVSFLKEA